MCAHTAGSVFDFATESASLISRGNRLGPVRNRSSGQSGIPAAAFEWTASQGRAGFTMQFEHYEAVPFFLTEQIIKARRAANKIR